MITQYTEQTVKAFISDKGFDWELKISVQGNKWLLDGKVFDNLKQVVSYTDAEYKRINPLGTIRPELGKQGGDAIKFDTTKLVVFKSQLRSPRPSKVKDPVASEQLKRSTGSDAYDAVTDMLRDENNKVYPELKEVQSIRTEWSSFIDKYALKFQFNSDRIVSIHHRDIIESKVSEINDKLAKAKNAIVAKLDDWKLVAQAKGNYVAEKFPSPRYFDGYGVIHYFSQIDESFDFKDEIAENAVEKIREDVSNAIKSISDYLAGDKKKFRDTSIKNIAESVGVLKESGMVADDTFNNLLDRIETAAGELNAPAIREAKNKVKDGVSSKVGAGDIENCQKYLDDVLDPIKELAEELDGLI
jgi:hypothetical protein